MDLLPPRPAPWQSLGARLRCWLDWFGVGRLLAVAASTVMVVAGGFWLLRAPPPPTESLLPYAGASPASLGPTGAPMSAQSSPIDAPAVMVHVAGAVRSPGVYRLAGGSRVVDAVAAAGGASTDANPDGVNLAAMVSDGDRVYLPRMGEPIAATPEAAPGDQPSGPIDLNTASVDQLDSLPGIGPATAAAIVAHRELHGPFASVDALTDVRGIGPAKVEALRGLATV